MVELSNQNDATLDGFQYHLGSQEEGTSRSLDPDHASDDQHDTDFVVEAYDGLGFRTGGNGIAIEVSEEQIAKATKILDFKTEDDVPYNDEESLWDNSNLDVERSPFVGFQTGGSGTTIVISDEQLAKVTQIFGGMNDQEDVNWGYSESRYETTYVESLPSIVPCFRTGGCGKAIAISDEQIAVATKLLDMNHKNDLHIEKEVVHDGLNADVESLQTGGSGKAIEVSDEQIARATQLLGIPHKEDIEKSTKSYVDKSEYADDESRPPVIIGFQTGGSGKAIEVSDEQIAKASQLLGIPHTEDIERSTESPDTSYQRRDKDPIQEAETDKKVEADRCHNFHDDKSSSYQNESDKCLHGVHESSLNNRDVDTCEEELSSSSDAIPIVTPAALASDECNYRVREGGSMTSSPPERLHHNPLHEMTNFANDPLLQSAIKSKRLFDSTVKARKNKCIDRSKVTLRELRGDATETISWASCIEHGVKDVTLRVTSVNAIKLRFNCNDNSPLFLLGQRDVPNCTNVGKVTDILDWLCCQGCDKTLVTEKWIQNHFRWIVWKLAAMERRFPEQLGGQYLNYGHVLSQIKGRYQKELCDAKRPAVRKVLNRDVSACLPMILCVGQILRFKQKSPQNAQHDQTIGKNVIDEIRLELSDGWYAVPAILDSVLSNLVGSGKIRVGSKLMICNAQLVGSEDGVDPLDDDYLSDRRDCRIALRITANNTRLAMWDAKLGFVHPKFTSQQGGSLLVKTLSGIFPDGGTVPAIDLVLCKVYPRLYLEQLKNDKAVVTNHLTEAEEAARQNDKEINRQRESEQFVSDGGTEFSEVRLPRCFISLRRSESHFFVHCACLI
jgi:breast cancer 2 susceptibility protein